MILRVTSQEKRILAIVATLFALGVLGVWIL
jgi:hypothetical protein